MTHRNLFPFIQDNGHNASPLTSLQNVNNEQLYKLQNKKAFKDNLHTFTETSVQILTSFDVGRRDYNTILRNSVGKKLVHVLGINPLVSKIKLKKSFEE